RSLVAAFGLNFDVYIHQRHCRRSHAGDARGVADGAWLDLGELFLHFAGKSADGAVVEPVGNISLFRFLKSLNRAVLLLQVALIFNFRLDRFELVADFRRERGWCLRRGILPDKKLRCYLPQALSKILDPDLRTLQHLREGLTEGRGKVIGRWSRAAGGRRLVR